MQYAVLSAVTSSKKFGYILFLFLFHAALNVLQSPQAQPGGGAEEQRAKRKLLFLHVDILMCRFRVKQRLR